MQGTGLLEQAKQELAEFVKWGLPKMSYGAVDYIFATAAAGCRVEFGIVQADGQVRLLA